MVFNQIYEYLNANILFSIYQSGFQPNHSTATAILNVTDDQARSQGAVGRSPPSPPKKKKKKKKKKRRSKKKKREKGERKKGRRKKKGN